MKTYKNIVENMTDEQFEEFVNSLIFKSNKLLPIDLNLPHNYEKENIHNIEVPDPFALLDSRKTKETRIQKIEIDDEIESEFKIAARNSKQLSSDLLDKMKEDKSKARMKRKNEED